MNDFDPSEAITSKGLLVPRLVCWDGLIPEPDPSETDTPVAIPLPRLVCWDGLIPEFLDRDEDASEVTTVF